MESLTPAYLRLLEANVYRKGGATQPAEDESLIVTLKREKPLGGPSHEPYF
jgi:hypothetical protein